jgi:acetyl-CoA carboxylase carboxyl transferase subunit beta
MGLFSRHKPKIKIQTSKRDGFSGWLKCTHCQELIHTNQLVDNSNCCPKCDYHYRLPATDRIRSLVDEDTFVELFTDLQPIDPLSFEDSKKYTERLEKAKSNSERDEAVICGKGTISGHAVAIAVLDFNFMAGSMGSVVGERLTRTIEYALEKELPLLFVSTSGGARMQESTLSLMQMAKTSAALGKLHEQGLPFISILTNPTSGGVTASFASLGDLIIAEPKALICFAGPRVIEQTIGEKLPPGAQKAEFLLDHGMIDCIVHRHQMKETVSKFIDFLTGNKRPYKSTEEEAHPKLPAPKKLKILSEHPKRTRRKVKKA